MDKRLGIWVLAAGMLLSSSANASGFLTLRGGILGGNYEFECCGGAVVDDSAYGASLGLGFGVARFFADLGLEYQEVGDAFFDRTDVLLTAGAFIGDRWSAFGGYRRGMFGEGFGDDEFFRQVGPFVGGSVTFQPGSRFALGLSLAYNSVEFQDSTGASLDLDADGVSLKLQANVLRSPHSFFIRGQRFSGRETFDYEESYLQLGYQMTFELTTW